MMAFLDLRTIRSVAVLLLLRLSSFALASDSSFTGCNSRRCSPDFDRKLAAVPGNAPVPNPLPPPPAPPNTRPALIAPSGSSMPGEDLPPVLRTPPPAMAPITSPTASASSSKLGSNVAVILGVTLGVLVFLLVSLSAAAYFRPQWLPWRSSRLTQYERHVPT